MQSSRYRPLVSCLFSHVVVVVVMGSARNARICRHLSGAHNTSQRVFNAFIFHQNLDPTTFNIDFSLFEAI